MRTTRARQAGIMLGFGLGAFFEGALLHPIAGVIYLGAWLVAAGGVLLLWSAVRGPGRLPSGRNFAGCCLVGWGVYNMAEGVLRHDLSREWMVFATGIGFAMLGIVLSWMHDEHVIERRSGYDRRSGSMLR